MFRQRDEIRKWLLEVIEKFRQKGATSPDKAMTADELGLPPGFEQAMKRRLGRSGIFVEVNGRYYLSKERLKQIEEQRSQGWRSRGSRRKLLPLRIIQMIVGIIVITLFLVSLFVESFEIRMILLFLIIVWLAISVLCIYYLVRFRKGIPRSL